MLGITLRWTSIPSRVSRNAPSGFMPQKSEISAGLMCHLARMQTLPLPFWDKSATSRGINPAWFLFISCTTNYFTIRFCNDIMKYETTYNTILVTERFNKLTSVFYASVLLLIMNFVITLSGSADYFDNVMTKFIVNNRTDSLKTDINLLFTIINCRIERARLLTRRMNFKFMCLSAYWP